MIIDIINSAGENVYLKDAAGNLNLAAAIPSTAITKAIEKGKQVNVTGIQFYFEGNDLFPLFNYLEDDGTGNLVKRNQPLISISVFKEILPGLFSDPYKSRIHSLGGFQDFKRGTFENCDVYKINNKPTIISLGTEQCKWNSIRYELPENISLDSAYWEIPAAKDTPPTAFNYTINLFAYDNVGNLLSGGAPIVLANNLDPTQKRIKKNINLQNVRFYELEVIADVKHDSTLTERIVTEKADTIGRPLLEGIYLLEPVQTKFDFYSLQEFLTECSDYEMFQLQGLPFKKLMATLNISSVLVQSPYENLGTNENEFIKLEILTDKLEVVTAKLTSSEMLKIN
jgi:hypothetical protein